MTPKNIEPETLTQGQIIRLSIATALIDAKGGVAVADAKAIADAVIIISKVVTDDEASVD